MPKWTWANIGAGQWELAATTRIKNFKVKNWFSEGKGVTIIAEIE
jgi:hypothetical protein